MATTINGVCEALAGALEDVPGLRAKGYADDTVNPNEAQVFTRDFDPRLTFGTTSHSYQLGVRVMVKRQEIRSAQKTLRDFMEPTGSTSILAAIEDESNWSAEVQYAEVTSIGQPFELENANETYWAVDFDVDVVW